MNPINQPLQHIVTSLPFRPTMPKNDHLLTWAQPWAQRDADNCQGNYFFKAKEVEVKEVSVPGLKKNYDSILEITGE